MLGIGFLVALTVLIRGTPCRTRGSFIKVGSSFAGAESDQQAAFEDSYVNQGLMRNDLLLVMIALTSPIIRPLGGVAAAVLQRWSYVSERKSVFDLLNIDARPRFLFERII